MIRRDWSTLAKTVLIHSLLLTGLFDSSVWAQDLPSTSAFLDEMETLMGTVGSKEGRWFKKNFRDAFEDKSVSDEIRKETMETAYGLQERKVSNSQGMAWATCKGVHVLLNNQRWDDWKGWHGHLKHFITEGSQTKGFAGLPQQQSIRCFCLACCTIHPRRPGIFEAVRKGVDNLSSSPESPSCECTNVETLVCLSKGDSTRILRSFREAIRSHGAKGFLDTTRKSSIGNGPPTRKRDWKADAWTAFDSANSREVRSPRTGARLTKLDVRFAASKGCCPNESAEPRTKEEKRTYPRFESRTGSAFGPGGRVSRSDLFWRAWLQVRGSKLAGHGVRWCSGRN